MIIKSLKSTWENIILAIIGNLIYTFVVIFYMKDMPLWLGIIIYGSVVFCFYIVGCMIISHGKTLILNEKGCTLRFWKYQKTYQWHEFKTKRMEDYRDVYRSPTDQAPYSAFVFFSVKESFKPLKILPDTYNIWFHPLSFSFFYVYFHVNHEWSNGKRCSRIYDVDEKEFLGKMQEWGVELEVYNAREERFK